VPQPTLAPTLTPFASVPLADLKTTELVDEVAGTWFEIWIPEGARHLRLSPKEIFVALEGKLMMAIGLAHEVPLDYEASLWRTTGALVLRSEFLADGYLVTAMGERCLDVVRLVRHTRATLRVHVHVMLGRRPGWQPQSCAEALCASLQIR
jgi:hypothetical protein